MPNAKISVEHDDRGLPLALRGGRSGVGGTDVTWVWDDAGNMTVRSDKAGATTFAYDPDNRLQNFTNPRFGFTGTRSYDKAGRLQYWGMQYQGQGDCNLASSHCSEWSIGYDHYGRTIDEGLYKWSSSGGDLLWGRQYWYDPDGNVTYEYTDSSSVVAEQGWQMYGYNQAGQLASWYWNGATVNYTYDGAGNRVAAGGKTFTYDNQNRVTSDGSTTYNWSLRGTLTSTVTGGTTTAVTEDAFGLETQNGATGYTYDGLGRIATRNAAVFAYGGLGLDPISDGTWTTTQDPATEAGFASASTIGDTLSGLSAGRSGGVRTLSSAGELDDLFAQLSHGGEVVENSYPGNAATFFSEVMVPAGTRIQVGEPCSLPTHRLV